MSKTLIYLVAIFALWMYFTFSRNSVIEKADEAQSGHGGTLVNHQTGGGGSGLSGKFTPGGGLVSTENTKIPSGLSGKF